MDTISKDKRSWNMSRIKARDTSIEVKVRKRLFSEGFRYRKNDKRFPGKPDIVLPKYKTVIFINGCFWHRHLGCKRATMPKTRTEYWETKLKRNVENDKKHNYEIEKMGWHPITIWECQIREDFEDTMLKITKSIKSSERQST